MQTRVDACLKQVGVPVDQLREHKAGRSSDGDRRGGRSGLCRLAGRRMRDGGVGSGLDDGQELRNDNVEVILHERISRSQRWVRDVP